MLPPFLGDGYNQGIASAFEATHEETGRLNDLVQPGEAPIAQVKQVKHPRLLG